MGKKTMCSRWICHYWKRARSSVAIRSLSCQRETTHCQHQCICVFGVWLDRVHEWHQRPSKRTWLELPLTVCSTDHQGPEAACYRWGHAADRPMHPHLLAGGGPPEKDSGEVQHGGKSAVFQPFGCTRHASFSFLRNFIMTLCFFFFKTFYYDIVGKAQQNTVVPAIKCPNTNSPPVLPFLHQGPQFPTPKFSPKVRKSFFVLFCLTFQKYKTTANTNLSLL